MLANVNRCYPAWLNLIPLILVFFVTLYVLMSYDQLPARVATHFNFWGEPDGFGNRSSILILPIIGLITTIGMTLINIFLIILPDDPKKTMNLDPKVLEALGSDKLEQMRCFTARSLLITTILVTMMMAYGSWGSVQVALGLRSGLGIWMIVLAGALIIVTIYMVIKTVAWSFTPVKK